MLTFLRELIRNQIICALVVLFSIAIGALIKLDMVTAKDVIIQVITAICALVTGQVVNEKNKRSTDISQTDSTTTTETKTETTG